MLHVEGVVPHVNAESERTKMECLQPVPNMTVPAWPEQFFMANMSVGFQEANKRISVHMLFKCNFEVPV